MDNVNPRRRHHPSTCADFFSPFEENLWNLFSFLCWITLIVCGLLHYSSEETWTSIRLIATSWLLDVEKNVECWHRAGLSGAKEKVEISPEDTERTIYVPEIYLWCGRLSPHFTCNAITVISVGQINLSNFQCEMRWSSARWCSRRAANWTCYADEMTKFAHFFPWTFVCALHLHQQLKLFFLPDAATKKTTFFPFFVWNNHKNSEELFTWHESSLLSNHEKTTGKIALHKEKQQRWEINTNKDEICR